MESNGLEIGYQLAGGTDDDRLAIFCGVLTAAWEIANADSALVRVRQVDEVSLDESVRAYGFSPEPPRRIEFGPFSFSFGSAYASAGVTDPAAACELVRRRVLDHSLFPPSAISIGLRQSEGTNNHEQDVICLELTSGTDVMSLSGAVVDSGLKQRLSEHIATQGASRGVQVTQVEK